MPIPSQVLRLMNANIRGATNEVESAIVSEHYFTAGDGYAGAKSLEMSADEHGQNSDEPMLIEPPEQLDMLTFCVLTLRGGFLITGQSYCSCPEEFDTDVGRRRARENAVSNAWPFIRYESTIRGAVTPTIVGPRRPTEEK